MVCGAENWDFVDFVYTNNASVDVRSKAERVSFFNDPTVMQHTNTTNAFFTLPNDQTSLEHSSSGM